MPYGAQIKLGMARQTAVGSGNAVTQPTSFHHLAVLSEDVGLDKEEVRSQNLTGRFEEGATYDGINRINGTLQYEITPKALGALLYCGIGPTTGVTSGSMRTYVFLPRSQDFNAQFCNEPITIYKQFSDSSSAEHYFDAQIGQLDFQFAQGALLRGSAVVVGGSRAATGIGSLALTLDTADLSLGFLWDATSISYGGSATGAKSDLTISINESIAPLYTLNGTLSPYKYTREGFREVAVSGNMYFDTRSAYNDFISGTQRRLVVTAQARKTQIQSGYFATLEIDVPQMKITQFKPGASGPSEVSASFTARGVIDSSSNYAVKVTLINTYAAGY